LLAIYKKGVEDDLSADEKKGPEETQRKLLGSTMDKTLFADLVKSMQQHNEIIAGTRKPARVTKVDAQSIKVLRAKAVQRSTLLEQTVGSLSGNVTKS
jgi:hypothetical protein